MPAGSTALADGVLLVMTSRPVIELFRLMSSPSMRVDTEAPPTLKLRMSLAEVLPLPALNRKVPADTWVVPRVTVSSTSAKPRMLAVGDKVSRPSRALLTVKTLVKVPAE